MADPKSGFYMEYSGNQYKVMYNHSQHGIIKRNPGVVSEEWIFTDYIEGKSSSATTLSQCKKVAKAHLKAVLKENHLL